MLTDEQRAAALLQQRSRLIRTLAGAVPATRRLDPVRRGEIVDDAIAELTVGYQRPIADQEELERVFWAYARRLAAQALDGRHDTVRGRFARAAPETLDSVAATTDIPAALAEADERRLAHEFAATLNDDEAEVFAVKWGGDHEAGERTIAKRLGITRAEARRRDRAVNNRLAEFALLVSTGRLCQQRSRQLQAVVHDHAGEQDLHLARVHLSHCLSCQAHYRELRSAAFGRKVAGFLPPTVAEPDRLRDWLSDLVVRQNDAVTAAAQLIASGFGRLAGQLAAKVVACVSGGIVAITACVATGVVPLPIPDFSPDGATKPRAAATATPTRTVIAAPTADPRLAALPTAKPETRKRSANEATRRNTTAKSQGPTGASGHEQAPASSAPATSLPDGQSEFGPSSATSTAAPAPVPAAPGAGEFGP